MDELYVSVQCWTLLNKQLLLIPWPLNNESDQPVLRDSEPIENILRHYGRKYVTGNGGHWP